LGGMLQQQSACVDLQSCCAARKAKEQLSMFLDPIN
jgi:hypothetical protein